MILDIILAVLFVIMILYGYKKGFVKIVARLASLIVAFVLAYLLAVTVGSYIANTGFGIGIQSSIAETIMNSLNSASESNVISIIKNKMQLEDQQQIIQKINGYVFTGIGFVVVYIISRIVLFIGQKILESIFELPVLKTFNKLGGIIASAVLYVLEISIILAVIKSISTLSFMSGIVNTVESSVITRMLYNHNIFTNLILSKIF